MSIAVLYLWGGHPWNYQEPKGRGNEEFYQYYVVLKFDPCIYRMRTGTD